MSGGRAPAGEEGTVNTVTDRLDAALERVRQRHQRAAAAARALGLTGPGASQQATSATYLQACQGLAAALADIPVLLKAIAAARSYQMGDEIDQAVSLAMGPGKPSPPG